MIKNFFLNLKEKRRHELVNHTKFPHFSARAVKIIRKCDPAIQPFFAYPFSFVIEKEIIQNLNTELAIKHRILMTSSNIKTKYKVINIDREKQ